MVMSAEEKKAKRKAYDQLPENKARNAARAKARAQSPAGKAQIKDCQQRYNNKNRDHLNSKQRDRDQHPDAVALRGTPEKRYLRHKANAKYRGLGFLLTFDQWWKIWEDSGHWDERGYNEGQYCMCRTADQGAYEAGNVRIDTIENNKAESLELRRGGWQE